MFSMLPKTEGRVGGGHSRLTGSEAVWLCLVAAALALGAGVWLARKAIAARYWAHRLEQGDRDAIAKLEALGLAATSSLLAVIGDNDPVVPQGPADVIPGGIMIRKPGGQATIKLPPIDAHAEASKLLRKIGASGEKALLQACTLAGPDRPRRARLCYALRSFGSRPARRAYQRAVIDEELGVYRFFPKELGSSVEAALEALACRQEDDGRWDAPRWGGRGASDEEVTALAMLAFLAAGYTDRSGRHAETVAAGLAFLAGRQGAGGCFGSGGMREHALASLALSEACGMTSDKQCPWHKAVQPATDCTLARQRSSGGWAERDEEDPDAFTSTLCVMQLKGAKISGFGVKADGFRKALEFFDSLAVQDGEDRMLVRPRPGDKPTPLSMACGIEVRECLGFPPADSRRMRLAEVLAPRAAECATDPWPACLGQVAMYLSGGDHWKNWNAVLKPLIIDGQAVSGANYGMWPAVSPEGRRLGLAGNTALRVLTLDVYYRYSWLLGGPGWYPLNKE